MRVAVVVSTFPPYQGGMGNAAAAHAEALRRAGHDVTVLAPGQGLRPLLRIGNAAVVPQLFWKLRAFDAVELHYPFFGGAEWVWAWRACFGRRKRLAVFYHMDTVGRGLLGAVFRVYRALFLRAILGAADRLLVSSRDYLAHSQAAMFKDDPRVRETPFAVDTERFRPRPGGATEGPLAIFVGALDRAHYFKGVPILLEAFSWTLKAVPEARLAIVGEGDLRAEYERRAVALGLADKVWFVGKMPDAELPHCFNRASFHVLPSTDRSEAFGIVTQEAMASGIPSIVSDLPGVRAVIAPGETGVLARPGDAGSLSRAMTDLFLAHERRAALGAAARARAERLYAASVVEKAIVEAVCG